jgi:hypothetical protein
LHFVESFTIGTFLFRFRAQLIRARDAAYMVVLKSIAKENFET